MASGKGLSDPSADRVDATGRFIVPGYNDMHSHALNLPDPSGSLALMLAEGVTGFRQMSGSPELLRRRRSGSLSLGAAAPALLQTPGEVLTTLNAGSSEAAGAEVRRQAEQGADFVKMVNASPEVFMAALAAGAEAGIPVLGHLQDGVDAVEAARAGFRGIEHLGPGSSIWTSCSSRGAEILSEAHAEPGITLPPFKIPFLDKIVAWKMRSLLVNPLAYSAPTAAVRVQAAVDTFGPARAARVAAELVAAGTWQCPTLVRVRHMELAGSPEYETDEFLRYMPAADVKRWRRVTRKFLGLPEEVRATYRALYPRQLELVKLFDDAGVAMMAGTDGGSLMAPGLTLRQEFAELASAGLSPLTILQMATVNPAAYPGCSTTMGLVAEGHDADLVVLEDSPLEAVENLHRIAGVVRAGRYFPAAELEALKARVAAGETVNSAS